MLDVQRKSGRPVSTVDTTRGQSHPVEVRSTLSPGGRREAESRIYSAVGPTSGDVDETSLTYSYGPDGALSRIDSAGAIGPGEISVTIDPVTGWTYSTSTPATRAVYQYDSAGRISDRRTTIGTGPGAVTITSPTTYDVAGNVTTESAWTYDYDKLGRLVRAEDSATGEVLEYRYDLASNRREVRRNGDLTQVLSFGAANEIDTGAHPEFAYDTYGRLISDTTSTGDRRHYIWDTASRLTGIDLYEVETGHFRNLRMSYDASGRLVERATYLDLTYLIERLSFHYDGDRLIAELDDTGVVREYLYAGGEAPSAMRARQGDGSYANYFFVTNTHGDVVAVTDRDGMIVNRYQYGPWGEATKLAEGVHQPFRYAGYRYEDGFDLYYLRARWYDAGTGRFLSRDAVRGTGKNLGSLNRYVYGTCAPPTMTDPTGRAPNCAGGNGRVYPGREFQVMRENIPQARAAQSLASKVPLELILNLIYTEQHENAAHRTLAEAGYWLGDEAANVGVMNVSGGQAKQIGYPWRPDDSPTLMDPAYNVIVGTQYLNHRYWQAIGAGALESVLGDRDAFLTLLWDSYKGWEDKSGNWDAHGILAKPESRDFCARLETIRGLGGR